MSEIMAIVNIDVLTLVGVILLLVLGAIGLKKVNNGSEIKITPEVIGDVEDTILIISSMAKIALENDELVKIVTNVLTDVIDYADRCLLDGYVLSKDQLMDKAIEICTDARIRLTTEQIELIDLGLKLIFKFA